MTVRQRLYNFTKVTLYFCVCKKGQVGIMIRRSRGISEILPICNPIQSLPFPLNAFQPSNFHSRYYHNGSRPSRTSVLPSASFPHSDPQPTGAEKGLPKRYKKPKFATPCMLTYLGRYSRWCSFQLGSPKKKKRKLTEFGICQASDIPSIQSLP